MHAHALPTAVDRDVQQGKGAKAQETTVQNAPVVQRIGEPVLPEAVDPVARLSVHSSEEETHIYL